MHCVVGWVLCTAPGQSKSAVRVPRQHTKHCTTLFTLSGRVPPPGSGLSASTATQERGGTRGQSGRWARGIDGDTGIHSIHAEESPYAVQVEQEGTRARREDKEACPTRHAKRGRRTKSGPDLSSFSVVWRCSDDARGTRPMFPKPGLVPSELAMVTAWLSLA